MSYKQRTSEKSSINPKGFTGIIAKNSNITVDKSYIEKGTSFINAYDNSNVVLKDCGSPKPVEMVKDEAYYADLKEKMVLEKDTINLPMWVEYNLDKVENKSDLKYSLAFNDENKFIKNLGNYTIDNDADINTTSKYRESIIEKAVNFEVSGEYTLETELFKDGKSTKDIDVTAPGNYYLNNVDSSIRGVWTLNSTDLVKDDTSMKFDAESPKLNLRFQKREVFPFKNGKNTYYLDGIDFQDKFGNKTIISSDIEYSSEPSYKKIVKTIGNSIEYSDEPLTLSVDNTGSVPMYYFKIVTNPKSNRKYIDGPYFNNFEYVDYYKKYYNGSTLDSKKLVTTDPTTFYFKYNDNTYSLEKFINNEYDDDELLSGDVKTLRDNFKINVEGDRLYVNDLTILASDKWAYSDNVTEKIYYYGFSHSTASTDGVNIRNQFYVINNDTKNALTLSQVVDGTINDFKSSNLTIYKPLDFEEEKTLVLNGEQNKLYIIQNKASSSLSSYLQDSYTVNIEKYDVSVSGSVSINDAARSLKFNQNASAYFECEMNHEDYYNTFTNRSLNYIKFNDWTNVKPSSTEIFAKYDLISGFLTSLGASTKVPKHNGDIKDHLSNSLEYIKSFLNINDFPFSEINSNGEITEDVWKKINYNCNNFNNDHASFVGVNVKTITLSGDSFIQLPDTFILLVTAGMKNDVTDTSLTPMTKVRCHGLTKTSSNNITANDLYELNNIPFNFSKNELDSNSKTTQISKTFTLSQNEINGLKDISKKKVKTAYNGYIESYLNENALSRISANPSGLYIKFNSDKTDKYYNLNDLTLIINNVTDDYHKDTQEGALFEAIRSKLNGKKIITPKLMSSQYFNAYSNGSIGEQGVASYDILCNNYYNAGSNTEGILNYFNLIQTNSSSYVAMFVCDNDGYPESGFINDNKEYIDSEISLNEETYSRIYEKVDQLSDITMNVSASLKDTLAIDKNTDGILIKNYNSLYSDTVINELPDYIAAEIVETDEDSKLYSEKRNELENQYISDYLTDIDSYYSSKGFIYQQGTINNAINSISGKIDSYLSNSSLLPVNNVNMNTILEGDNYGKDWNTKKIVSGYLTLKSVDGLGKITDFNKEYKYIDKSKPTINVVSKTLNPLISFTINKGNITNNKLSVGADTVASYVNSKNLISINKENASFNYEGVEFENFDKDLMLDDKLKNVFNENVDSEITINDETEKLENLLTTSQKDMYFDGKYTYEFKNKLYEDQDGYLKLANNEDLSGDVLWYNGINVTTDTANNTVIKGVYSNGVMTLSMPLKANYNNGEGDIQLYYDSNCEMIVDHVSGNLLLHNVNDGRHILKSNDSLEVADGQTLVYDNELMYEPKYEMKNIYERASLNDWFDIDTYINYSNLNKNIYNNYSLTILNDNKNISKNAAMLQMTFDSTSGVTLAKENSIVVESNVPEITDLQIIKGLTNLKVNTGLYNLSSLFTKDNIQSYKMFSFNFMIPEAEWDELDDEMYAKSPDFGKSIATIKDDLLSGTLTKAQTSLLEKLSFNGKFTAKYGMLKDGTIENVGSYLEKYEFNTYSVGFVANVFKSEQTNDGSQKSLVVTSNNTSLCFSFYLNKVENDFAGTTTLKYVTFQTSKGPYIQLTNINVYAKLSSDNKLFISFTVNDNKDYVYMDKSLSGSMPLSKNVQIVVNEMTSNLINRDSVIKADRRFVENIMGDKFGTVNSFENFYTSDDYNTISQITGKITASHSFNEIAALTSQLKIDYNITSKLNDANHAWLSGTESVLTTYNISYTLDKTRVVSGNDLIKYNRIEEVGKITLGNLIDSTVDADGCFFIWMTPGDLVMTMESVNPLSGEIETYNVLNISNLTASNISNGVIANRYVKPHDISTNLFYYNTSDDNNINLSSEVFIINAKKMYNEIDENEQEPEGGELDIKLSGLYDKEIILTSYIPLQENDKQTLKEMVPYINSNTFEYQLWERDNERTIPEGYKEVRYTDMEPKAPQWLLYKLIDGQEFTTAGDFEIPVKTVCNSNSDDNIIEYGLNEFNVPCKMTMKFKDLLFKQKVREGISFDDVKDIEYDQKVFAPDMFNKVSYSVCSSRWNLSPLSSNNKPLNAEGSDFKQGYSDDAAYWDYGFTANYDSKLADKDYSLGGSGFFNDVEQMRQVNNAVNKWKTTYVDSKYSKLYAFSDYSPRLSGSHCVGTPYTNMLSSLLLKLNNGNGADGYYTRKAEIVNIATDIKNFNYIGTINELEKYDVYTSADVVKGKPSFSQILNDVIEIKFDNVKVLDTTLKGLKYFKVFDSENNDENNGSIAVYFDGLLYNKQCFINKGVEYISINNTKYQLLQILTNTVVLSNDGRMSGSLMIRLCKYDINNQDKIELHNIKPLSPTIKSLKVTFDDATKPLLKDGKLLGVDNNTWQKFISLTGKEIKFDENDFNAQPYFSIQSYEDLKSNIIEKYDEKGNVIGLYVTLKLKGLRKFKESGFRYYFDRPELVTLTNQEMVDDYAEYGNALSGVTIEDYRPSASIGDIVTSGYIMAEYNAIKTEPFIGQKSVGDFSYSYNPRGKRDFQIEIMTKKSGEQFLNKNIYYVNKPVGHWYNMSLYNYEKQQSKDVDFETTQHVGIQLTDVTYDNINDLPTTCDEIFNCYVSNDEIINGRKLGSLDYNNSDLSYMAASGGCMKNYKSMYTFYFDSCNRNTYNLWYCDDATSLANNEIITEAEFESAKRKNKDLFKLTGFDANHDYFNFAEAGNIKLFANKEVGNALNKLSGDLYKLSDGSNIKNGVGQLITSNNAFKNIMTGYYPERIAYNDDINYYVLRKKDMTFHMTGIDNMKCNGVMWICTPDLGFTKNGNSQAKNSSGLEKSYFNSYYESLNKINEYVEFFGDPSHKLPPVSYTSKVLNSDYATLIYNNCEKTTGIQKAIDENGESVYSYFNYDKNPLTIAYVWDNSQISRVESYSLVNGALTKSENNLTWVQSSENQYIVEIGSMFNYQDDEVTENRITIKADGIIERQSIIEPVLTSPFSFEQRSNNNGIVTVNDKIIATAALGYKNGYPVNGVMVYNSKGSVDINTDNTTYLYVAQNNSQIDCKFGATEEKPIYVDTVQENNASYSEKFTFIPNPSYSFDKTAEEADTILTEYYGGSTDALKESIVSYGMRADNVFEYTQSFAEYSVYDYDSSSINYFTKANKNDSAKTAKFTFNLTALKALSNSILDYSSINVFYDKTLFEIAEGNSSLTENTNKSVETMNVFYYDGSLIPSSLYNNKQSISNVSTLRPTDDLYIKLDKSLNGNVAPTMEITWNENLVTSYKDFTDKIESIENENKSGIAIFDSFFSCNLTGVKITINEEHFSNAPIFIKIYLLKCIGIDESDNFEYKWINDDTLNFDIRDTYKNLYTYGSGTREITHQFIAPIGNSNLTTHVFGIKFEIQNIVPQQSEFNSCIIDDIKVYASNILNIYGLPRAVEDIFVRKNEANCRNFYDMSVSEYVWRLPNTVAEWSEIKSMFENDVTSEENKYIESDAYKILEKNNVFDNLTQIETSNESITKRLTDSGENFSLLNTYYITTDDSLTNGKLDSIMSDNYLSENENMTITWKYVDYVYIYFDSYNDTNARFLLDKNFGSKIYDAVRAKLNANIENINSNSAFSDKFTFKGGIAIAKSEMIEETQNSAIFEWKSQSENVYDWAEVHKTNEYDIYGTQTVTTTYDTYQDEYWNDEVHSSTYLYTTKINDVNTKKNRTVTENVEYDELRGTRKESKIIIENPKYESTDSWIASFQPISIKYRID